MATGSTFNVRTYGRKSSAKRKQSMEDMTPQRKRRKVSEETQETQAVSTDIEDDDHDTRAAAMMATPSRRTVAKDLSKLFESVTPTSSPSRSPTKLASRMLARSKTDSSIDSNTNFHFGRTPSLPNLPSSSPPKLALSPVHEPRPVAIPTNTRTYAGKSRSFLVAIPAASLDAVPGAEEEDEYTSRESYASLRSRWGVDNSEDDPYLPLGSPSRSDATSTPSGTPTKAGRARTKAQQEALLRAQVVLPNGMMNPLKSITELRSKGESRRFLDEVGYLFEGMDSSGGIGLRRASALEITTKLCDTEFARKAKAADFLGRAWDVFLEAGAGKGEDKILDTLLAFFAALVSRDPASFTDLAQRTPLPSESSQKSPPSVVDTLFSLLGAPADPLALVAAASSTQDRARNDVELKKLGVGKKDRASFVTIHETILSKSSLFPPGTPISLPLLLTRALHTLPPSLLLTTHLPVLLASLRRLLYPLSTSSSSSSSAHLTWHDAAKDIPFEGVLYHLRMLDVFLLGQWGVPHAEEGAGKEQVNGNGVGKDLSESVMEKAREEWLVDALVALGVCAELRGGASAHKSMETTLRVLVSLTHADVLWARRVLENECALPFVMRTILRSGRTEDRVQVKVEHEDVDVDVKEVVKDGSKRNGNGKSKSNGRGKDVGKGKGKERVKQEVDEVVDISDDEDEGEESDTDTHALDRLCLALGLLTNLVQVVEGTKDLLRDIRLHPGCTLTKRTCIRRCTCSSPLPSSSSSTSTQITALDVLVRLYNRSLPPSSPSPSSFKSEPDSPALEQEHDAADTLFLRGHLAVLFGLLIRGSHANRVHILGALAHPSSGSGYNGRGAGERAKLARLVEQAREFIAFYEVLGGGGDGNGMRGEDAESEREGRIARDVISFLEELRDGAV